MRLVFLLAATALLGLFGCKGSCRQLSEKLCECALNSLEKDACLRRASSEEARYAPTPEQEAVCQELLPQCDCHALHTAEGKRRCGLARPKNAS